MQTICLFLSRQKKQKQRLNSLGARVHIGVLQTLSKGNAKKWIHILLHAKRDFFDTDCVSSSEVIQDFAN